MSLDIIHPNPASDRAFIEPWHERQARRHIIGSAERFRVEQKRRFQALAAEEKRRETARAQRRAERQVRDALDGLRSAERLSAIVRNAVAARPEVAFAHPVERIIREVALKHAVPVKDIKGPSRLKPIVRARHEVAYRCRTETNASFPEIGRRLGGRDHTTILHGFRQHEMRLARGEAK